MNENQHTISNINTWYRKNKKDVKSLLTFWKSSGILSKLFEQRIWKRQGTGEGSKDSEKGPWRKRIKVISSCRCAAPECLKKFKKRLDKPMRLWYLKKVADGKRKRQKTSRNFEKKFLTGARRSAIIATFRRKRCVPCKLNNVTKRKHQTGGFVVRNHNEPTKKLCGPGWVNYREAQL